MTTSDEAGAFKYICDDIVKSETDDRVYRGLVLNNDMKVMLVCDPKTEKAAASMDVHIGKLSNQISDFSSWLSFQEIKKYL